jgi:type IV secretion system protein VirB10
MNAPQNTIQPDPDPAEQKGLRDGDDKFEALDGEPGIPNVAHRPGVTVSKRTLGVVVGIISLLVFAVFTLFSQRGGATSPDEDHGKRPAQRPAAAATEAKRLEMPALPTLASGSAPPGVIIPALEPTAEERAAPIPLRGGKGGSAAPMLPEDAPVLLLSSRAAATAANRGDGAGAESGPPSASRAATRNLQEYQKQAQGLLESLLKRTEGTPGAPGALTRAAPTMVGAPAASSSGNGLFGGELPTSATPRVTAGQLEPRSLTLPKGTTFTCALKTRIVSATSGFLGCQVQRNVFSDDGRVLLVERGSHLDGEYRATSVKPGSVRIPVLWTRLRMPNGVTVDLDSPGTGALGESGVDGHVDNRWGERIGAALLLSLIDDAVKVMVSNQASQGQGDTVVLSSTTNTGGDLAEKVLDSTIHIPPLIYQHQGSIVGIYVARDVDFSSVYELQASARGPRP